MSLTAERDVSRSYAWLLVVGGIIGLTAASTLLVEKIALLRDSTYVPSCSINPILSCGSVMNTPQADAFGFPNPIIGVAAFSALVTLGTVMLTQRSMPQWIWTGLQLGATFGVVFVHWLIFQSLYRIGALCPYCMIVWVVVIPVFVYTTRLNLVLAPASWHRSLSSLADYSGTVLAAWYLVLCVLIGVRFWDYWLTVFT